MVTDTVDVGIKMYISGTKNIILRRESRRIEWRRLLQKELETRTGF